MSKYKHVKDDWVREALEEYKDKINYDVWNDVTSVPYNLTVNYSMKANEYVQPRTDKPTRSNDRNDKS